MRPPTNRILTSLVVLLLAALSPSARADEEEHGPPPLAIGASAPDFCLPGIDGKTHCLPDYASAKVLVIAFTCNHCPTAQLYESRIKQIAADYKDRSVTVIAIQPNNPMAVRLDEMGYTDVGDSFDDMKTRAAYRHFNFAYLYDGEDQKIARAYGPAATPHLFIFDSQRKLRYEGRVDNNPRETLVTRRDAREAIDALLAGKPVVVAKTPSVGCSTKWIYKEEGRKAELAEIESQPVTLQPASADQTSKPCAKMIPANFASSISGPLGALPAFRKCPKFKPCSACTATAPLKSSPSASTTPTKNPPRSPLSAKLHATSRNLILGSTDIYTLLAAFDPDWNAAVPYTMLIKPNGEVVYKNQGPINPLELRRIIISNLPDDDYLGHQAYWQSQPPAQPN